MLKLEGTLVLVPEVDLFVFLLEDFKSKLILIFGTEGEALGSNVRLELLLEQLGRLRWLEEVLETQKGGSLGELHHLSLKIF